VYPLRFESLRRSGPPLHLRSSDTHLHVFSRIRRAENTIPFCANRRCALPSFAGDATALVLVNKRIITPRSTTAEESDKQQTRII
jgi:hypothetical protein